MMGFGVSFVLRMMAYFGIEAVPMDPGIMSRAVFFYCIIFSCKSISSECVRPKVISGLT